MAAVGHSVVATIQGQQQSFSQLARFLRLPDGAPVVDKTGLTGTYDFAFEYAYDLPGASPAADAPAAPDLYHALQQLGLQLVPKKLPFNVVVVDAIDKTPTLN
jgi:uncharacterized protein (TIGR03435 family)